jgi:hypothetical protein
MVKNFKRWLADDRVFYSLLLCLVAVASFALGRASAGEGWGSGTVGIGNFGSGAALLVAAPGAEPAVPQVDNSLGGLGAVSEATTTPEIARAYVASRSGTKYHDRRCASAARISAANRVYFATQAEAKAAGYTPAATCPLLSSSLP